MTNGSGGYCANAGIKVVPRFTGQAKQDPDFGVPSLAPLLGTVKRIHAGARVARTTRATTWSSSRTRIRHRGRKPSWSSSFPGSQRAREAAPHGWSHVLVVR